MVDLIVSEGRLAWSFVLSLLLFTVVVLAADVVWRRTKLSGKAVAVGSLGTTVVGAAIIYALVH